MKSLNLVQKERNWGNISDVYTKLTNTKITDPKSLAMDELRLAILHL